MSQTINRQLENTLYSPRFEHDNCGIGAVVNINGIKSHATVANALTIVETLEHRAGKDADGKPLPVITDGCWGLEMGEFSF